MILKVKHEVQLSGGRYLVLESSFSSLILICIYWCLPTPTWSTRSIFGNQQFAHSELQWIAINVNMMSWCCNVTWRRVFANMKKDVTQKLCLHTPVISDFILLYICIFSGDKLIRPGCITACALFLLAWFSEFTSLLRILLHPDSNPPRMIQRPTLQFPIDLFLNMQNCLSSGNK